MTNLQLKETVSKPSNSDFYNQFFTSNNVTRLIGLFGQFISALTEFHFIYSALGGVYSPFMDINNLGPLLGGLIAIYIFEVIGVRIYLVRIIRQLVNRDFRGKERKVLFMFNMMFVVSLCGSNLLLSFLGQKYSFSEKTNVVVTDKTQPIEVEKNAQLATIKNQYNSYNKELTTNYNNEVAAVTARYDNDIKELKNSQYKFKDVAWKYNQYTLSIDKKLASKQTDLSDLKKQFNAELKASKQTYISEQNALTAQYNTRINDVSNSSKSNIEMWELVQKFTLPILIIFILLSWGAIIYNEIFLKGSGQNIEIKKVERRPLLITVLIAGIYDKIYQLFYYLVARILGTKKYHFGQITQNVVRYDINEIIKKPSDKNTLKVAASVDAHKQKSIRQIGFNTNRNDNQINNQNNVIKNVNNQLILSDLSNDNTKSDTNNEYRNTNIVEAKNTPNRICKNCGNGFTYKHHKQLYCSDKCRIEAWEKRTGRTMKKKAKK